MDPARVPPDLRLAATLFETLRRDSLDPPGLTRDAYGRGEEKAHETCRAAAKDAGLLVSTDFAGNSYFTLPGADRGAKWLMMGSHLDTVKHGGNYDGAAGVLAGLAVASGLKRAGVVPRRDIVVMATRAEETVWFPFSFPSSKAALGIMPEGVVDGVRRSDTGRSFAEHMKELGYDPAAIRNGKRHLDPARILGWIEPHIEQGPELIERDRACAVVSAISGGFRFRECQISGEYAHVGGAPRRVRKDCVAAIADIVHAMNAAWAEMEAQGHFLLVTFGVVSTDPSMHAWSKVPGRLRFTLDVRGVDEDVIEVMRRRFAAIIAEAEQRHGVAISLGPDTGPQMARMDGGLCHALHDAARLRAIPVHEMPSGGGHDALAFHYAGVPAAMLFIRNQNGSHNPDEAMEFEDFAQAARILTTVAATI